MTPKETRARLAEALRARRDELHITQEVAAVRCNVSVRYWRAVEAGRPSLRFEILQKIVDGLGWSWYDFAQVMSGPPPSREAPSSVHRQVDEVWKGGAGPARTALASLLEALAPPGGRRGRRK